MFVVSAESFMDAQLVAWLRHLAAAGRVVTHRQQAGQDTSAADTEYTDLQWVAYVDDCRRSGMQTCGSAAVVDCEINAPRVAISPELREVETLLM